ncbi:MAG: EamA family transporter [Candidatus Cloacimonadales bacterium]
MIYIVLSIIASVMIGNLLQLYQTKDSSINIIQVFLGNYLVAAIVSFFMIDSFDTNIKLLDLGIGALFGSFFLINFLSYQYNITKNGLSISISVMRMSVVIPILVSIMFFAESLPFMNYFGILVVMIAFLFLGKNSYIKSKMWLFILFISTGLTETGMKIIHEVATASHSQMLFYLFGFAFLFNLMIVIKRGDKFNFKYFTAGLILGVPNQLSSLFFLQGLNTVEAAYAYPLVASNVLLLGFLTDKFIWKSKFNKYQYLTYALIVVGVILLNMR